MNIDPNIEILADQWLQENYARDEEIALLRKAFCDGYAKAGDKRKAKKFDPVGIPLPSWIPRLAWAHWCADRKARKKPITERAAQMQIKQLSDYMRQGHQPAEVIAYSIAGGYQGLFAPKTTASSEPAWRKEQRERTQLAAPGVAVQSVLATQFFDIEAEAVRRIE